MKKAQICIVCEEDIEDKDVGYLVYPGQTIYFTICKACCDITPNVEQAEQHWRKRALRWNRHRKIEEAAKKACTHLHRLDQCGALTREDDPILEALKNALEYNVNPQEPPQAP